MFKKGLIVAGVLAFVCLGVFYFRRQENGSAKPEPGLPAVHLSEIQALGAKLQRQGVMNSEDYAHIRAIDKSIRASGVVSMTDLDYLLRLVSTTNAPSNNPAYVRMYAMAILSDLKSFKDGQKERIYQTCAPLLKSTDPLDERGALEIVKFQKDPRAIPLVLPLQNSPKENVRKSAKMYLEAVGYVPKS